MGEGIKYDEGKVMVELVPFEAVEDLALIYEYGIQKGYPRNNWKKGMRWGRVFAACLRHLFAFWRKSDIDFESGRSHLLHALWNITTLYWYWKHSVGEDDR